MEQVTESISFFNSALVFDLPERVPTGLFPVTIHLPAHVVMVDQSRHKGGHVQGYKGHRGWKDHIHTCKMQRTDLPLTFGLLGSLLSAPPAMMTSGAR